MVVPGHRLMVGMVAVALAVMFVGLGARGVSANQLESCPPAPDGTAGQTQENAANTTTGGQATLVIVDEKGQLVPVNDGQLCLATANANGTGEATAGFAVQGEPGAPISGTTCTVPLPEGAVPGTVLVVTVQGAGDVPANSGAPATSCAVSTLSPATTGDPNAASGGASFSIAGEACAVSPANQGGQSVPGAQANTQPGAQAAPVGTAEAGAGASGQTAPVQGNPQGQGCEVIVLNPASENGVGGAASADATPICVVSPDNGATAGSASGGTTSGKPAEGTFIVNGQGIDCAAGQPVTVRPVEPTTSSAAPAGTDGSFSCVIQDSNNPNTLICTKQP